MTERKVVVVLDETKAREYVSDDYIAPRELKDAIRAALARKDEPWEGWTRPSMIGRLVRDSKPSTNKWGLFKTTRVLVIPLGEL